VLEEMGSRNRGRGTMFCGPHSDVYSEEKTCEKKRGKKSQIVSDEKKEKGGVEGGRVEIAKQKEIWARTVSIFFMRVFCCAKFLNKKMDTCKT